MTKTINPFSNEALAQILESLDFEYYGDEAKQFIKIDKIPLAVTAILPNIPKFVLNGYTYHFQMGRLFRTGDKVKAKPKDIGEEIAYFVDKVPVFFKDVKAKLDKLGGL